MTEGHRICNRIHGSVQAVTGGAVRTVSRKAAALAGGAILAAGGLGAGIYAAVGGGSAAAGGGSAATVGPGPVRGHVAEHTRPRPPLRVVSVTPANDSRGADGADNVTVTFNEPLIASDPLPWLSPAVAGTWQRWGKTAMFTPQTGIPAKTRETVMVSQTVSGVRSVEKFSFRTAAYS